MPTDNEPTAADASLCGPAIWAAEVMGIADPAEKIRLTRRYADPTHWDGSVGSLEAWRAVAATLPKRPARPDRPELRPPRDMPKRSTGPKGLVALLHALAHIELTAIDLAWDIIVRFPEETHGLGAAFYRDWMAVAWDEALHFEMLQERLTELGSSYGELPAHDGLWSAAAATTGDLAGRLVCVPLVHEARGLDTTPPTLAKLDKVQADPRIIATIRRIADDEITHVGCGVRWFQALAAQRGQDPATVFRDKVAQYQPGGPKPPFDAEARAAAGFPPEWYQSFH